MWKKRRAPSLNPARMFLLLLPLSLPPPSIHDRAVGIKKAWYFFGMKPEGKCKFASVAVICMPLPPPYSRNTCVRRLCCGLLVCGDSAASMNSVFLK